MPHGGFMWSSSELNVCEIPGDTPVGLILEVNIDYHRHLHDDNSDFPFLPLNKCLGKNKTTKLLTTLEFKELYLSLWEFKTINRMQYFAFYNFFKG